VRSKRRATGLRQSGARVGRRGRLLRRRGQQYVIALTSFREDDLVQGALQAVAMALQLKMLL
jgi:hypothetical protein